MGVFVSFKGWEGGREGGWVDDIIYHMRYPSLLSLTLEEAEAAVALRPLEGLLHLPALAAPVQVVAVHDLGREGGGGG